MTPERLDHAAERRSGRVRVARGIREKHVGKLAGLHIYTVNGELLRRTVDTDFTMGGNPARYGYVPAGELWIDSYMSPVDQTATLLHEYVEYVLMSEKSLSYDDAHDRATAAEQRLRVKLAKQRLRKLHLPSVIRAMKTK